MSKNEINMILTHHTAWTWKDIRKTFLILVDKHFPKTNKLHKIFNRIMSKLATAVYLILPAR